MDADGVSSKITHTAESTAPYPVFAYGITDANMASTSMRVTEAVCGNGSNRHRSTNKCCRMFVMQEHRTLLWPRISQNRCANRQAKADHRRTIPLVDRRNNPT